MLHEVCGDAQLKEGIRCTVQVAACGVPGRRGAGIRNGGRLGDLFVCEYELLG